MSTRRSERRRLQSMVSVRFTPSEEVVVRAAAERAGESVSGYIRRAALRSDLPRTTLSWTPPVPTRRTCAASTVTLVRR